MDLIQTPDDTDIRLLLMEIENCLSERGYNRVEAYAFLRTKTTTITVSWDSGLHHKFFHNDAFHQSLKWARSLDYPYEAAIGPWFEVTQ